MKSANKKIGAITLAAFFAGASISAIVHAVIKSTDESSPALGAAFSADEPGTLDELRSAEAGPLWTNESGLSEDGRYLIDQIRLTAFEGLNPKRYHLAALSTAMTAPWEPRRQEQMELLLTAAYKQLIIDLGQGIVVPERTQRAWFQQPDQVDAHAEFAALVSGETTVEESLGKYRQSLDTYYRLSFALSHYQLIEHNGGWADIPYGMTIKPEDIDNRLVLIRDRLAMTDDLNSADIAFDSPEADRYTQDLVAAVKRFQRRHGLEQDGIIGNNTLKAMNMPVSEKVEILKANLERLRWLPRKLGQRHVITNIAEYTLRVMDGGKEVMSMPIVTGKPRFKTPVFSDTMEYLVVNPTWTVPRSITYRELLPKELANPGYLARNNFELIREEQGQLVSVSPNSLDREEYVGNRFPYTIRQKSGSGNALGKVKFIFPNKHSVYLHDTPSKRLFSRRDRAFSHGCVRLSDPKGLAKKLLSYEGWSSRDVEKLFSKNDTQRIRLKEPLPNHIIYLTSWVDNGEVQFRPDVYGHDKDLTVALANPSKARWPASLFAQFEESPDLKLSQGIEF